MHKACFITLEGIEGVGKTTALAALRAQFEATKIDALFTREPGGTAIAEKIRQLLLEHHEETLLPETELLLMFAGRIQHIRHVIEPALARGQWVVSDRFIDASYAYQGGGRELGEERVAILEAWMGQVAKPDLTFLLDASVELAMTRAKTRSSPDRIEKEDMNFFERARAVYLRRAAHDPRFCVIDASQPLEIVEKKIKTQLQVLIDSKK